MEFLGFEFRKKDTAEKQSLDAFIPKSDDDGSLVVAAGGQYGTVIDLEGAAKNEAELVTKYREMVMHAEVESAVDDIVNEVIVQSDDEPVSINFDNVPNIPDVVKQAIQAEFRQVLRLLDFNHQGYDLFKRWYVDGRLYYQVVIDKNNLIGGIQELRYIDPRKIKKIKEQKRKKIVGATTTETVVADDKEYFVYNEKGFNGKPGLGVNVQVPVTTATGLKIAKDSIVHCTSGLLDKNSSLVVSHLHKAIKPLNQLRALEDATIIYRISRAPERRIFYIDVGNLPKMKAEQYLRDMMTRYKNKVVYDASTGEIRDDRKFMTMLEDFWLPRREGNRGTEISTLAGGQNLGEMTDVEYFQKVLYKSLSVPVSRIEPDYSFSIGRATEISRDEVKFAKFVGRLRNRFSHLFIKVLEKQLVLRQIVTQDEWNVLAKDIQFRFAKDNYFAELKEIEVLNGKVGAYQALYATGAVGKYYSNKWVRTNIFRQDQEMIAQMDTEIKQEWNDPVYNQPIPGEEPADKQ